MKTIHKIAVALVLLVASVAQASTIQMTVNGLVCAFCAQGIEKRLRKFPAIEDVVVSLSHRLVAVGLREGQDISDAELRKALTEAGYTVKAIERTDASMDSIRARIGESKQ